MSPRLFWVCLSEETPNIQGPQADGYRRVLRPQGRWAAEVAKGSRLRREVSSWSKHPRIRRAAFTA